jgi:hypothetical protein
MSKLTIINEDGTLTDDSAQKILEHTEIMECACPQHLLKVLMAVRDFQLYETGCIIKFPKDAEIHAWLLEESKQMEKHITTTIVELMKKEGVVDEDLYFCVPPKLETVE